MSFRNFHINIENTRNLLWTEEIQKIRPAGEGRDARARPDRFLLYRLV